MYSIPPRARNLQKKQAACRHWRRRSTLAAPLVPFPACLRLCKLLRSLSCLPPSPVKSPDPRASTRCSVKVAPPSSRSSTGQIISRLLNCRRFVAKVFVAEARFPRNTRWRFEFASVKDKVGNRGLKLFLRIQSIRVRDQKLTASYSFKTSVAGKLQDRRGRQLGDSGVEIQTSNLPLLTG